MFLQLLWYQELEMAVFVMVVMSRSILKKLKIVFIDFSIAAAIHSKIGKTREIRESFFIHLLFIHLNA